MALTDTTEGRMIARWLDDAGLTPRLPPIALRLIGLVDQVSRYGVVSALAFALDVSAFLALAETGVPAALAGIAGYVLGMLLHYTMSARFVFKRRAVNKSDARLFTEFVVSGAVGLAVTAAVIAVTVGTFDMAPLSAKVLAAGLSFTAVFALRRTVVFASPSSRAA